MKSSEVCSLLIIDSGMLGNDSSSKGNSPIGNIGVGGIEVGSVDAKSEEIEADKEGKKTSS